jgi:hypothetical protein
LRNNRWVSRLLNPPYVLLAHNVRRHPAPDGTD